MKNLYLTLTAALLATFTQLASATIINDDYVGARYYASWGDRIGNSTFEIHNMDVTLTGTILNVQINTNYAGHTGTLGTGYGDLFLSSSWNPVGDSPYITDDHESGTNWTYGISLDGDIYNGDNLVKNSSTRFISNAGGTTSLYELNGSNDQDAFLSENLTSGTFRNGQEVVIDKNSSTTVDTDINGTWSISAIDANDFISFSIDLAGTTLLNGDEIALHWGMTCGNDTIEGAYAVPEPAILALLAIGLVGIGVSNRKKL